MRSATKVKAALLDEATRWKIAIRAGVGVDNIDVKLCKQKGVVVENTPWGNVTSM